MKEMASTAPLPPPTPTVRIPHHRKRQKYLSNDSPTTNKILHPNKNEKHSNKFVPIVLSLDMAREIGDNNRAQGIYSAFSWSMFQ